jgi:peptidyl-tRNA hydrolase
VSEKRAVDPIVQYLIVNREMLSLGPGVLAAQAAHAAVAGYLAGAESEPARAWAGGTFTKILLAVDDEPALRALASALTASGIAHKLLEESRLGAKATAIGVAPLPKSVLTPILGRLPLLK